jgi:hypothetical protein
VLMRFRFVTLLAVLATAACTYVPVHTDANAAILHACHSYAWAGSFRGNGGMRATLANPLNESRLRAAIAASMQARGVQPASDPAAADCLVGYGIGAQTVVYGPGPYGGWAWRGPYWGSWGWYGPYAYSEGIIGVDIYDGKTKEPMWHGHVAQDLNGVTGTEAEQRIGAAVQAILARYPS